MAIPGLAPDLETREESEMFGVDLKMRNPFGRKQAEQRTEKTK